MRKVLLALRHVLEEVCPEFLAPRKVFLSFRHDFLEKGRIHEARRTGFDDPGTGEGAPRHFLEGMTPGEDLPRPILFELTHFLLSLTTGFFDLPTDEEVLRRRFLSRRHLLKSRPRFVESRVRSLEFLPHFLKSFRPSLESPCRSLESSGRSVFDGDPVVPEREQPFAPDIWDRGWDQRWRERPLPALFNL